jgi:secondary thiamine-phosphate synthase enzyme
MIHTLSITTRGQGLLEITDEINNPIRGAAGGAQGASGGLCTVFIQHTSASLTIQENADPSARRDLETWLNRLVKEDDPLYTHTSEGPDDMPSHIKAALTSTSLSIPIVEGKLALGRWQGVYLWEHRHGSHARKIVLHITMD